MSVQDILPTGIMEEINELFVAENKLSAAVAEASTLPTVSITKVTSSLTLTYIFKRMKMWVYTGCVRTITHPVS